MGDELLLEINEWLDSLGIDRAYRKAMKESYQKDLPALKAQLAKVKQHYEQKIVKELEELHRPDYRMLDVIRYLKYRFDIKQDYNDEQKRLDRPDRKKAIREILDGITTSRQYGYITTEDKEKAADQLLALFPDREEAKREERKAQGEWLLEEYDRTPPGKRIGLFETVISKLVDEQPLEGD